MALIALANRSDRVLAIDDTTGRLWYASQAGDGTLTPLIEAVVGTSKSDIDGSVIDRIDVNYATAAEVVLQPGHVGKPYEILGIFLISAGANTLTISDGTTTFTGGALTLIEGSGFILPQVDPPQYHYRTAVGAGINITLTQAVQISGNIWYREV